jgi:hypothetical protein
LTTDCILWELGIYHGALGTVVQFGYKESDAEDMKYFKMLPSGKTDGSLARQVNNGRKLPYVFVKMDNIKIDETVIPDRIVIFAPFHYRVCKDKVGTVWR